MNLADYVHFVRDNNIICDLSNLKNVQKFVGSNITSNRYLKLGTHYRISPSTYKSSPLNFFYMYLMPCVENILYSSFVAFS